VLVADDQSDVVLALRLLLRDAGLDSDAAASVSEIRSRLSDGEYDLLLMDLNYARDTTSGREGLELLAEVHARDPLLPVVVMTGWGSIETAVEAMRRGARGFIHKPWDNTALADAIRREVDDGRAMRHAERRVVREQTEAQAIQRALLPPAMPDVDGCDIAARWVPASAFGGDCYDVTPLDADRVAISIADVCGKGLPAALLMANLQASVRAFAAADASPRFVSTRVNRELVRNAALRRFVTFFYAVHDRRQGRLTFVNAGHNPPVLVRADGSIARLSTGGTVLGAFEDATFEEAAISVAPGDRLLLFTDGITEACGADNDEFGEERLLAAVQDGTTADAAAVVDRIFSAVGRFSAFQDDATVVVAAFR
jgi:sigma-B regulation protein RsbU (phosphoserine phosphatase)